MERLQEILAKSGYTGLTSNRTPQEYEQSKADSFNSSEGSMHEGDGYHCDICHNKGMLMRAVEYNGNWTTVTRDCKCMKVRRSIRLMNKSGLKDIIKDNTFDKFFVDETWQGNIKELAKEYAANPSGWFFIGGQSGCGKTHICTAICRELLLAGREVIYMLWRDDVVKIKSAATDSDEYAELVNKFKTAEILYIDDLFKTGRGHYGEKQYPTGADVNVAFELLNYRYNNKMPTIISSECTVDDVMDIDEATGSRIYEKAKAINIRPDRSRNYRIKGAVCL